MNDPVQTALSGQWGHLMPPLGLAILGGIVKALVGRKRSACTWWRLLLETLLDMLVNGVVAGFVGALVGLCLQGTGWSQGVQWALIGLSGFLGADLLKVLAARWLETVKKCDLPGGK